MIATLSGHLMPIVSALEWDPTACAVNSGFIGSWQTCPQNEGDSM